jgi:dihydrofolate reductase
MADGGSYERFYEGVGALVSGSATYEFLLNHMEEGGEWPYPSKPYWVLSSRDLGTPGDERADVRVVDGSVADLRDRLLESAGDRNLWVVGGGNVASQFVDADLLDEVLVTVVPVVIGAGKPLFDRPLDAALRLTGTRTHDNGMVELRYAR